MPILSVAFNGAGKNPAMKKIDGYPVIVQSPENDNEAWGVIVPDIPGCFSAGDTLEEALENTREAIAMQIEDILERKGKTKPS